MRIYILLLTLILTINSPSSLAANPWDFCVALVSKVGILNNKKILSQAVSRLIPDKQKPNNSEFIKTLNSDPKDLPTQQLQENLARLKKLKNENNLSASEKAVFGGLISKMEIESAARTKLSSETINKLNLDRPLSIDRTANGKNAMIEDLNTLIEARKNPLLTKQDKEKISSRIQKLLDSPHEDNPKLAAENNYYFDEFLSKQKSNLEPAELGKALNRKTTHADNMERHSFELAEKTAFPNGLGEDGRGKSIVNAIMSRMGEGFDQTTKIPLDSKEDLTAAATYVNKLIEAQRKNPTAGVNPKHLNQMLANLESLAQAQGTSLDSLLKAPQHRKSISDKFPNQQKNISKIFSQIDSGEKIPTSFKEHEELLKTIEDLYASKKLSPDEMSQLDPYYKKLKSSIEKRNAASAAKTDSFLIRKFSNEIADDKYDGTTLYEHLNSIFKHKNSNDISNKDIARLDAHIDSLLENTPIKFSSLNEANDSLQALRKFKSDNKNSLSQKQLALLEERRKYIFEAASKGNNKAAMEGGAKGNEEVASLDPFPPPKKPAAPEAQTEVPASSTAFSVVQKSLGPTNTPATNAPAHLASSTSGSLVPASSVVGPSIEAHKAPTAVANTGKTEKPSSRPITSEEFQRMANGGPNDPLTRAAAQSAVEALRARGAQQTPPAATPAPKSKVKEAAKKLAIATVGTGVALQLMAPSGSENSPAPTPESDDDAAKRHQEGSIPITDVIGDVPLTTNLAGTSPASTTSSPDSPNPTPTVINVPAPANTEGGLPQAPGAPQPDQPSGTPHPEAPAVVPEEPAAPTPPSPTDTPAPTPAPGGQPSPSPSPSGAPSSAPHGNDGTYLPPPPYSPPSSAPSNYSGPPAKKESAVSKFFSAIGNFFSSIFKAILSIFGAK